MATSSNNVRVRNSGRVALSVSILNTKTLQKTEVMIQPRGGVTLPANYIVEPNFAIRYKSVLRIITK